MIARTLEIFILSNFNITKKCPPERDTVFWKGILYYIVYYLYTYVNINNICIHFTVTAY